MTEMGDTTRLTFHMPTRGLIGFKGVFTSLTRGEGILNRAFLVRRIPPYACRLVAVVLQREGTSQPFSARAHSFSAFVLWSTQ
jgi:predicted membrane GTPase involved in stress response